MATNRLSFNIHGLGVRDPQRLINFHAVYKPAWSLFMGDINLARICKAASLATNIIMRFRGVLNDDKPHLLYSPQSYIDLLKKEMGGFDAWYYLNNESGNSPELVNWIVETCRLGVAQGMRFIVWNPSVGGYEKSDFPTLLPLFRFAAANWQNVIIGLHEYYAAIITSGFIGGAPDDPRHVNFIPPENWPTSIYNPPVTTFHCGRFRWVKEYMFLNGITNVRFMITEFGPDRLNDVGDWLQGLPKTAPYNEIRGIKTTQEALKRLYPNQDWIAIVLKMLTYADKVVYSDFSVEGILFYCYGSNDSQWENFDCEGLGIPEGLIAYNGMQPPAPPDPLPPPIPPAPPVTIPSNPGIGVRIIVDAPAQIAYYNMRSAPSITAGIIGTVKPNTIALIYPSTVTDDTAKNRYYWMKKPDNTSGWVAYLGKLDSPTNPVDLSKLEALAAKIKLQSEELNKTISEISAEIAALKV